MISSQPCWQPDSGRQFWNERGGTFARSFFGSPTTNLYLKDEQRLFQRYFGELQGKKLLKLDLWNEAQNTEILFWSAEQGAECYGIDIAETTALKALTRSRVLAIPVRITVGDVSAIPFPDNTFDCLYTMGTLEHLPEAEAAFAEIARVLKPDGVAIIGVPNKNDPFLFSIASRFLQSLKKYPYGHERWYTNGELNTQLQKHGLRIKYCDGILFLPWFLRILDLYLWLHYPPACRLTSLLVRPFSLVAGIQWLVRRYGYMTVCIAKK